VQSVREDRRSRSHHIFDGADELVVEEDVLGLILGVGSRVQHPTHTAGHRPEVLLPRVLRHETNAPNKTRSLRLDGDAVQQSFVSRPAECSRCFAASCGASYWECVELGWGPKAALWSAGSSHIYHASVSQRGYTLHTQIICTHTYLHTFTFLSFLCR